MTTDDNYAYWRDHGHGWLSEYNCRRMEDFYFVAQELLIHHIVTRNNVRSVLDYGCGVGRHIRHLSHIPGLEIYGYDQSPTMLAELATWADPAWFAANVRQGPPIGPIPLGDRIVELSFTSEVLLHTRSEDVSAILAELVRVSSRGIVHLEPHCDYPLRELDHGGCWYHDLVAAYEALGVPARRLGRPFYSQELVLVSLEPTFVIDRSFVDLMADSDEALRPALDRGRRMASHLGSSSMTPDALPIPFFLRSPLPAEVASMQTPASAVELKEAEEVRQRFYLANGPSAYMVDVVRAFRPLAGASLYIEIGSRDKGNIAWLAKRLATDATIIDVDLQHIPDATRRLRSDLPLGQTYHQVAGDSSSLATRAQVEQAMGGRQADAIFLDSSHMYNHILKEFNAYYSLLRPGGLLLIHDVFWEGNNDGKGKSQAMSVIDRFIPVYTVYMNEPIRRFFPLESQHDVWGGVGVVIRVDR